MSLRKIFHHYIHKYLNIVIAANTYAERHGIKQLGRKIVIAINKKIISNKIKHSSPSEEGFTTNRHLNLRQWMAIDKELRPDLNPIGLYKTNFGESYTTIVTDSIGRNSLFGGVATALIFGTLLANKRDQSFRIITRTEPGSLDEFANLLDIYNISLNNNLVLDFCPRASSIPNISHHPND